MSSATTRQPPSQNFCQLKIISCGDPIHRIGDMGSITLAYSIIPPHQSRMDEGARQCAAKRHHIKLINCMSAGRTYSRHHTLKLVKTVKTCDM